MKWSVPYPNIFPIHLTCSERVPNLTSHMSTSDESESSTSRSLWVRFEISSSSERHHHLAYHLHTTKGSSSCLDFTCSQQSKTCCKTSTQAQSYMRVRLSGVLSAIKGGRCVCSTSPSRVDVLTLQCIEQRTSHTLCGTISLSRTSPSANPPWLTSTVALSSSERHTYAMTWISSRTSRLFSWRRT